MSLNDGRRILMLSIHGYVAAEPELSKPDTGGQVVFVIEMAKRFARLGYPVDVVTRQFEDQPQEEPIEAGARVLRVPFGGGGFIRKEDMHNHLDAFVENFLTIAEREGRPYALINSHYWDAGWAGSQIARALAIPHVHTPHSLGQQKRKDMLDAGDDPDQAEITYRFDERIRKEYLVYRSCNHLLPTNRPQAEALQQQYGIGPDRMTVIPAGLDEDRFTPGSEAHIAEVRQRLNLTEHDVYTVGRAAENKGIDLLIEALPWLRGLVPEARLQLAVGDDAEQDRQMIAQWQQRADELGVGEHVHWLGYVPDEAMRDYYHGAGVFALPSRYEPIGMTALEAMACGRPSVITVHGGLYDYLNFGQQALYADPLRPQAFGVMLAMPMLHPELHQRLAEEGSRFARRRFGWTGIARQTLEVFERSLTTAEQIDHRDDTLTAV